MAKQIVLHHDGKDYTLEFNRKSIQQMERSGFIASEIGEKPMSTLPTLFAGAFQMHHRFLDKRVIDEMLYNIKDKEDFISRLAEMYNEPLVALVDEPEEAEGNITWEASW